MKKQARCFEDVLDRGASHAVMDAGLRVVEVASIKGTVGKCGELDEHFRYMRRWDRHESNRRYMIEAVMQSHAVFPPVDRYLYRGEYFIVDGNRRVSAALQMGIAFIDAIVTEYIDRDDHLAMAGALYRRRFEQATGIRSISLVFEHGYEFLFREAESYESEEDRSEHRNGWYAQLFLPRCGLIKRSILPKWYKTLSIGDIYVLIGEFYCNYLGGIPAHLDYDSIISGFIFAHGLPQRRKLRSPFYRMLSRVLMMRMGGM